MENQRKPTEFNPDNAELLEAVSHPLRVKILQALNESPMSLDALGVAVAVDDGAQLSFHLVKLGHLVRTLTDGRYELTGDGKEAVWNIGSMTERKEEGKGI